MTEAEPTTLIDVAASFTRLDAAFTQFHGKLFSYIPPDSAQFAGFLTGWNLRSASFPNHHPATAVVGRLGGLISVYSRKVMTVEGGQLRILFELGELKLPDCEYFALISPMEKSGSETRYSKAYESINFLRSLIAGSFGKLPFYSWVSDFDFDASGQVSLSTDVVRMPMYADFLKLVDANLFNEIALRLSLQQEGYRQRLQSACNFFESAMDQRDEAFRFASYWIALEILTGSTSDGIRAALSKAYGTDNKTFAGQQLLFNEIADIRHDLFHSGRFRTLQSYQERLLQLYFWDIVIHQIGLKSKGLAMMLIKSGFIEQEKQERSGPPGPLP